MIKHRKGLAITSLQDQFHFNQEFIRCNQYLELNPRSGREHDKASVD